MILDSLFRSGLYESLGPGFVAAFEWLRKHGAEAAGDPVEMDGGRVIARPGSYETHPRDPSKFESHRRYADVQFVAEGEEVVEVAPAEGLEPVVPYDSARDVAWFSSDAVRQQIVLPAGSFLLLWPHEAHQPGLSPASGARRIRKVVVKVAVGEGEGSPR